MQAVSRYLHINCIFTIIWFFFGREALLPMSVKPVNLLTAAALPNLPKRKPVADKICNGFVLLSDFINMVL